MATKNDHKDLIAAVLVRGAVRTRHDVKQALQVLRLSRKNACVIIEDNATNRGLLDKCKDVITYGPVSEELITELKAKRASRKDAEGKELNVYALHPPRGGFGGQGTKVGYQEGGVLGLRRKAMDDFLRRML